MGHFTYKAVDKGGGHVDGTIEAADRKSAVTLLADKGHFVVHIVDGAHAAEKGGDSEGAVDLSKLLKIGGGHVSHRDIMAMTTQLSTALRAGLPLFNALELLGQQQHKKAMKELLGDLVESVNGGSSLSEAMSKHPDVFSPLYLSMIRVGETGGILEQTTEQLAGILSRDEKIKTSLKNASAYPIFVLCLGMASVILIVTVILPKILDTIAGGVALLPLPTRILMAVSAFFQNLFTSVVGWAAIVGTVAAIVYFIKWKNGEGKLKWDSFKLKIPILGSVLRTIAVGRFARTLGALTKGGVTILEALAVVRDTLGNELLGGAIDEVAEKVKKGASLAEPLAESGYFPPLLVQITSIGEETGKLDEMLLNAAETFDTEADAAINRFMSIFPAMLILVLALIIGFIVVATLLPIVSMSLGGGML